MRIQHNITAMNSYRNYTNNASKLSKNLEKLSSGYKINRAGDDAAGLAISEKMRSQITGLNAAQKNVKDGISLVKTAEGALQEVHDMLNRMTYLATQSANGTYQDDVDRDNLQKELNALRTEVDRIADASDFNGQKLLNGELTSAGTVFTAGSATAKASAGLTATGLSGAEDQSATAIGSKAVKALSNIKIAGVSVAVTDITSETTNAEAITAIQSAVNAAMAKANAEGAKGDATYDKLGKANVTITATNTFKVDFEQTTMTIGNGKALTLQIGDNAETYNQLAVEIGDMHADALALTDVDISSQAGAQAAIASIKEAINTVSETRGDLGAFQNRLEHTNNNLAVMEENIQDAESTIRDTDVADEMTEYTKNNILLQSAQAMLAQANQLPQGVLQLLG